MIFVDCCDKIRFKLVLKNVVKLFKGSLNNSFQEAFNKILFQQLTHDRSCITHSLVHHFETVPNSKKLQTTTKIWLLKDFEIQIA